MIGKLTKLFLVWKAVLISLLFLTPKQYDTSSHLIFPEVGPVSLVWRLVKNAIERLVIWDSVFYVTGAQRGLLYEHEWAFGRLWSKLIEVAGGLVYPSWWQLSTTHWLGAVSIAIAITSHYLSVLLLHKLTLMMFPGKLRMASLSAKLYIFSPAGMFLVAGYSESTFAFLSFIGLYFRERKLYIFSGIAFALSCGIRGNGVLWGIVFLNDLIPALNSLNIKHSISIVIGGGLIGAAVIGLQVYPYLLFCPERGEWCQNTLPSIFSYVQAKYWNVGLLKYWTPNNIPNFLFALPTLTMLYKSLRYYQTQERLRPYLIVQLVIVASAVLVYHVQIITRIATCLPLMYWYAAEMLTSTSLSQVKLGSRFKTYSICWCIAQGILFAAFLPPA